MIDPDTLTGFMDRHLPSVNRAFAQLNGIKGSPDLRRLKAGLGLLPALVGPVQPFNQAIAHHYQTPGSLGGAVRMLRGYDHSGAFKMAGPTNLADAEIVMHGGSRNPWIVIDQENRMVPTSRMLHQVAQEERVQSVLVRACNFKEELIQTPARMQTIHGLGLHLTVPKGVTPQSSSLWTEGAVISQGKKVSIFPAQALEALSEAKAGRAWQPGTMVSAARKDKSGIGIYRARSGETMLGRYAVQARTDGKFTFQLKESLPLSQAPRIEGEMVAPGKYRFTLPGGKSTDSLTLAKFQLARQQGQRPAGELAQVAMAPGVMDEVPLRVARELHPTPHGDNLAAGKITARKTLNELHVNLESKTGRWLKQFMRLPFKRHSQVDPMAAALQAAEMTKDSSWSERAGARIGGKFQDIVDDQARLLEEIRAARKQMEELRERGRATKKQRLAGAAAAARGRGGAVGPALESAADITGSAAKGADAVGPPTRRSFQPGKIVQGALVANAVLLGAAFLSTFRDKSPDRTFAAPPPSPHPEHGPTEQQRTEVATHRATPTPPRSSTMVSIADADLDMALLDDGFAAHLRHGYAHA